MKQPTRHGHVAPFSVTSAETLVVSDEMTAFADARTSIERRNELAAQHLPLVRFVARKLSSNLPDYVELDDLVSWGSLGLLDAIEKFEPERGHRFSTYAVTRIRGAILDGLQQMDWAPKQVTSRVRSIRRLRETMTNELGYEPTVDQMAERIGVDVAEVRTWIVNDHVTRVKSLSAPAGGEDGGDIDIFDTDWEHGLAAEISELRSRMTSAVARLPAREAAVLTLYYRDGLTLREIAGVLGVSVSSATQAHTHLVESVRERLTVMGGTAA